jgi:cytochrome P450
MNLIELADDRRPTPQPADESHVAFLNTLDPAFQLDSDELRRAREANWYARTPLGYAVLRYREVATLLRDARLRQGAHQWLALNGVSDGPLVDWWRLLILNVEGEEHTRLRRLVSKAFTPPAVERLRTSMRAAASELIDGLAARGECDFMEAFADPYPLDVICQLLDIPPHARRRFHGWADDLGLAFSTQVAEQRERVEAALLGLYACADELLTERRRAPGQDLITALIAAEEAGDRLSTEELRAMVVGLVFAGNDTTRNQLGLGMYAFLRHPEQWALLAAHPELAPRAVEEIMRVYPAVPSIGRVPREDFEFGGLRLEAGSFVSLLVAAANTDPAVFGVHAGFDISVERAAQQLTFGGGIHHCLGNWLARAEIQEALPLLAGRLHQPVLSASPTWRPTLGIYGPLTLPVRFRSDAPTLAA